MPLTPESWLATAFFAIVAAAFTSMAASTLWHQRWVRALPALDPAAPIDASGLAPRVSAIVPARDEAEGIAATVQALLAQQGVALEVLAVDDRSTDDTAGEVRRAGASDPRVRLVQVTALPDGWLGKSHACHAGAAAATGDWLLFTDADVRLAPDTLARALQVVARTGVDHVALTPSPRHATIPGYAWHCVFLASIANWISGANRDHPRAFIGVGAFNLVRASTYQAMGGYEALRLTVLDDVRLGLLVRRAGGRTRAFLGAADARCDWGTSLRQGVRLTEKNYFAAIDFRWPVVVAIVAILGGLWLGALTALLSGSWLGIAAGISPWLLAIPAAGFTRRLGWPLRAALLAPVCYLVVIAAMVRSAVITWRQGGVRWRDTLYPIAQLRDGAVR
jgi:cellulose synthase/poly-beta-1,6-N-acetylglucosamine synthase-like glycosyltransferase